MTTPTFGEELCRNALGQQAVAEVLEAMAERMIVMFQEPLPDADDLRRTFACSLAKCKQHGQVLALFVQWLLIEDDYAAVNSTSDENLKAKIRRVADSFKFRDRVISSNDFHAAAYSADEASRTENRTGCKSGPKSALALFVAYEFAEAAFCVIRYSEGSDHHLSAAVKAAAVGASAATGVLAPVLEWTVKAAAGLGLPRQHPERHHFEEYMLLAQEAQQASQLKVLAKLVELLKANARQAEETAG